MIPSVLVAVIAAPLRKPKAIRSLGGFWKDIGRADFRRTDLLTVIHIIIQFNRDTPCFQPLRVKLFDITGNPSVERVAGSRAVRLCVPAEQLRTIRCIPAFTVVSVRPYDLFAVFTAVIKQLTVGIKDKAILSICHSAERCAALNAVFLLCDALPRQELLAILRFRCLAVLGIPVQQITVAGIILKLQFRNRCCAILVIYKYNTFPPCFEEMRRIQFRLILQFTADTEGKEGRIASRHPFQFNRAVPFWDRYFIGAASHIANNIMIAGAPIARIGKSKRVVACHLSGFDLFADLRSTVRCRRTSALYGQCAHMRVDIQVADRGGHVRRIERNFSCFSVQNAGIAASSCAQFKGCSIRKYIFTCACVELHMRRAAVYHADCHDCGRTLTGESPK